MQTGTANGARIQMLPNGTVGGNDNNNSRIAQSGAANYAELNLRAANSSQPGSPNFLIDQTGRSNFAKLEVRGSSGSGSGAPGLNNSVQIVQAASSAGSTLGQTANGLVWGNQNAVTINQSGVDDNTIGGTLTGQYGFEIKGNSNTVGLTQNGNKNSINMGITGGVAGSGNQVAINQTNSNNRVGTGFVGGATVTNTSDRGLYITGNGNSVNISQDGGDEVKSLQNGDDKLIVRQQNGISSVAQSNRVLIDQGAGSQDAIITQNGAGNFVYGLGGTGTFAVQGGGSANKADVTQTASNGFTNELRLSQISTGAMNMATINQNATGVSNLAEVKQNGSGNMATINQTGN
jgi:hypothetical protein